MSAPPTVRAAHARLAALRRDRPNDEQAIHDARRALDVARGRAGRDSSRPPAGRCIVVSGCSFCGLPATAGNRGGGGAGRARLDLALDVCSDCASLDPDRPGAAPRAAARLLGADEEDQHLPEALRLEPGALDGLLVEDPGDPLRTARRAPAARPWAHVPAATLAALGRAEAKGRELELRAGRARRAPASAGPPASPQGCLLCGAGTSGSWRRVLTSVFTAGPGLVEGHLCSTCSRAHGAVGAVGATLVEQAYLAAAGITWPAGVRAPSVRPWIATGLPPGDPWSWVNVRRPEPDPTAADLAAEVAGLRAEVAALRAGGAT